MSRTAWCLGSSQQAQQGQARARTNHCSQVRVGIHHLPLLHASRGRPEWLAGPKQVHIHRKGKIIMQNHPVPQQSGLPARPGTATGASAWPLTQASYMWRALPNGALLCAETQLQLRFKRRRTARQTEYQFRPCSRNF